MKYVAFSIAFVLVALLAQAQTNIPKVYTFKQKGLSDRLKLISPNLQTNKEILTQDKTSVLPLQNEGVKRGSNNRGDIYSMKVDNMPCLKPFAVNDEIPNATQPQLVVPLVSKEKK